MSGENPADACIRFDWQYAREKGKYGLKSLDSRQRRVLERKLRDYERYTLDSFLKARGVRLHEFDLKTCRKAPSEHQQMQVREELLVRIPELGPVSRFRVSGKMRVVGYRDRNVFFVVWVDANHEMG